ncbi:uncharacterized protein LOC127728252 isoform X2 [Mytilus californianus]|uniref:uncharacterized protein LOC127728252 isoform X2 n=1 Tax=Mytilus californianus TaxID=6549 RepID=UPI0022460A38|nr:uncharacterized protein LOC127728252 isoform X2 [Mytilus californianus]
MNIRHLIVICQILIFTCSGTYSTVYYSGVEKKTFYDAETACQEFGGNLLSFGQLFVKALLTCQQYVYVWNGRPVYKQLQGCYTGDASKKTPTDLRKSDKRIAICADFCISDNFTHFGITTTECFCYELGDFASLNRSASCDVSVCPGNLYDMCGVDRHQILYEKDKEFDIGSCHARNVHTNGYSHRFIGYCKETLPYLCKVGGSDDVRCSLTESTPTVITSSTDNTDTVIVSMTVVDNSKIDRNTTASDRSSTLSTLRSKVTNQALTKTKESNKKGKRRRRQWNRVTMQSQTYISRTQKRTAEIYIILQCNITSSLDHLKSIHSKLEIKCTTRNT